MQGLSGVSRSLSQEKQGSQILSLYPIRYTGLPSQGEWGTGHSPVGLKKEATSCFLDV